MHQRFDAESSPYYLQMQQFQRERLIGVILAYSGCERTVGMTIDYTHQRHAFGKPLSDNQVSSFAWPSC